MEASPCFFIWRYTTNSKDKKYLEASFLKVRLYFIAYNLIGFSSITVVDADNDAHGKYLLSFQNLSGIYNKRRGRVCPPRRNFLRKSLRFCLPPLAVSAQKRTANVEKSRCNKKAHPAFRQDPRKIACGYFQANGINLVYFAPKSPVFCSFISYLRHKISRWASSWGF